MRVVESLNGALAVLMERDPDLHLIGEDILDPYGGAFKVTRGLSSRFPDRVLTMPISEACIVGFGAGMAMRGKPAIVEIMFGDFLALAADQLINHASKLRWVYNDQVSVPLIIRAPMGGRRGYGATHSQCLEKHFCGVPGLTVLAIHPYEEPGALIHRAYAMRQPVLIIENKTMYARPVATNGELPRPSAPDLAILTYGGCVEPAVSAAIRLESEEEILTEVVALSQLHPFPVETIRQVSERCTRILAVEEGSEGWGFASECARALINRPVSFAELTAPPHPIPNCRTWELEILPGMDSIYRAAVALFETS